MNILRIHAETRRRGENCGAGVASDRALFAPRRHPVVHLLPLILLAACHRDMRDQPRYEVLEASTFFANGMASRPVPQGTVPRGRLEANDPAATGRENGEFLQRIPLELSETLLARGRERFNIYCSPCHGRMADGEGMIVRRGFRKPPSLHSDRLRDAPAGHFFDVVTHGFGLMPAYGHHVPPRDRWAIVAYIRALQLSQNATIDDVPAGERKALEEAAP